MSLQERIEQLLQRDPWVSHLKPQVICSWRYVRTLEDGRHEFKCAGCGDVQIVKELIGGTQTRTCTRTTL